MNKGWKKVRKIMKDCGSITSEFLLNLRYVISCITVTSLPIECDVPPTQTRSPRRHLWKCIIWQYATISPTIWRTIPPVEIGMCHHVTVSVSTEFSDVMSYCSVSGLYTFWDHTTQKVCSLWQLEQWMWISRGTLINQINDVNACKNSFPFIVCVLSAFNALFRALWLLLI